MMWSGFPYPEHPKKELKTMRKRNFIKSFLYYSAIIAIPILKGQEYQKYGEDGYGYDG